MHSMRTLVIFAIAAFAFAQSTHVEDPIKRPTTRPFDAKTDREFRLDPSAGYKLDRGPNKVGMIGELILHDAKRDKDLPLRIRYPEEVDGDAKFPLIVFSHGLGGSSEAFRELSAHWASYGYVVIHPTHSDSIKLRVKAGEDLSDVRDDPRRLRDRIDPMDRLADVRFILDSLDRIEEKTPGLRDKEGHGRIDRERIGMAGHSAGAYTTQMAIGVKVRGARAGSGLRPHSVGDNRIKAAILISGQGLKTRSFNKESWADLDKPMLAIAGSLDTAPVGDETPESRRQPFELAKAGDKYLIFIEGATHGSYAGNETTRFLKERPTTELRVITETVAAGTTAFWDAYLRGETGGKAYLAGDGIERLSGGAAAISRK